MAIGLCILILSIALYITNILLHVCGKMIAWLFSLAIYILVGVIWVTFAGLSIAIIPVIAICGLIFSLVLHK